MSKDNSGSAFPITFYWDEPNSERNGMTLRDYFAGEALQGLVASCTNGQEVAPGLGAKWCYEMADAMLEARK